VGTITTLTGNSGGAVSADGLGNINIEGGDNTTVVGTPLTNTLTVNLDKSIAQPDTNATGTEGLYSLGGNRFMHNYGTSNTFLGEDAGNLTLTTADDNVGIGKTSLFSLSTGNTNTAVGYSSLLQTSSANSSTAVGFSALQGANSNENTAVGFASSMSLVTGTNNSTFGYNSGFNYIGAESRNILIGSDVLGVAGESNITRIGASQNKCFIDGITGITPAAIGDVTIIDANDQLGTIAHGTDGQVLVASTLGNPAFATLTSSGSTITFTPGVNTLNLEAGSAVPVSFLTDDTNSAVPALGVLSVAGGTNTGSTSAGSTVTINLDADLTDINSITTSTGGSLRTGTTAADTTLLQAYDVDGITYKTFATLTANNTPTMDLDTDVTIGTNYIYRATGTDIPVTDGGTGASTLAAHGILIGQGTSAITSQTLTDGQLLIGKTGAFDPVAATLNAGSGISITPGAGSITIAATGMDFSWSTVTVDTSLVVNAGVFADKAGLLTLTLPATAAKGDVLKVIGLNTDVGWRISQNANQQIHMGSLSTTVGVGGYIESTQKYDAIELVCAVAGASTIWIRQSMAGNLTIV